jgi:type VI secretion system protein ImpM
MENGATIGLYGKHPAFGDFIAAGLSDEIREMAESWLNRVMPQLRAGWGDAWEARYDAAPALRFWFGSLLTGAGSFCGVLAPSRDKVGRRFPLLAGVAGSDLLPPVLDGGQGFYDTVQGYIAGFERAPGTAGAEMAAGLAEALGEDPPPAAALPDSGFWATRPGNDVARLWADVAATDHLRAAQRRSYVWFAGEDSGASALYAAETLPAAEALAWLLAGVAQTLDVATPEVTDVLDDAPDTSGHGAVNPESTVQAREAGQS